MKGFFPMKKFLLLALLAAAAAGCATQAAHGTHGVGVSTHVRIRTEPAGGAIRYRGEGRASFRWQWARNHRAKVREGMELPIARTETEFDTRYGRITAYAVWPDGTQSPKVTVPLSSFRDPEPIVLKRDPSLPRIKNER